MRLIVGEYKSNKFNTVSGAAAAIPTTALMRTHLSPSLQHGLLVTSLATPKSAHDKPWEAGKSRNTYHLFGRSQILPELLEFVG